MSPSNGRLNPASTDSLLISVGLHASSVTSRSTLAEARLLLSSVCWSVGSERLSKLFALSARREISLGSSFEERVFSRRAFMPPRASGKLHNTTIRTSIFSP